MATTSAPSLCSFHPISNLISRCLKTFSHFVRRPLRSLLKCVTHRGTPRKLTPSFAGTERRFVWPRRRRKRLWKSLQPDLLMCACGVKTTLQSNWRLGASVLKNGFAREWMCTPTASMKMPAKRPPTHMRCCLEKIIEYFPFSRSSRNLFLLHSHKINFCVFHAETGLICREAAG